MNHPRPKRSRTSRVATRTQKTLLPLVAFGGGLAGLPASALELGDITVESRLGQPLRASIAYAIAPHEQLSDSCVTLGLGASASGLPGAGRATVSIADGAILLTGRTPVREPIVAALVNVDCAYTANISREYLLFIDPAVPVFDKQPAKVAVVPPQADVSSRDANAPLRGNTVSSTPRVRAASPEVDQSPIAASSRYRVQPGDTLSQIVQRIENRSASLWPAVNAIFDANPDAFIGADPNRLKAGSWLMIPDLVAAGAPATVATNAASSAAAPSESTASIDAATDIAVTAGAPLEMAEAGTVTSLSDSSNDLSPAGTDAISDNPFVDGAETNTGNVVIADTQLEGPVTVSPSPNVTTAVIGSDTRATTSSSSWLLWLAGSGLALIIALLLFGRLFRGRPSESEPAALMPQRRARDHEPSFVQDDGGIEVVTHTGYTIDDDSPTAENLTLDADLVLGTGLDAGAEVDMEVAQDFGFAAPAELDLELPFEPQPSIPESDTGIFAMDGDDTSVLENGDSDDDDYDLSVVLDATKMPRPEEITERDLQAVEVEAVNDIAKTDSYSIDSEVDLVILEQDYEDELTATQALNVEITRASAERARDLRRKKEGFDDEITSEVIAATPLASVTELDVTAQLPSHGDGIDDEDTGINEAPTVQMPAAENDETAEMEVDGGKVDTKAI